MTKEMQELLAKRSGLVAQGEALKTDGKYADLTKVTDQISELDNSINALNNFEETQKNNHASNLTVDDGITLPAEPKSHKDDRPFRSFGEQLSAIAKFRKTGTYDKRLGVINSIQGANEGAGSDGGFAVQTDFAGTILDTAVQQSEILRRVDMYEVSSNANSAKWLRAKNSNTDSIFGGIAMHWASEGGTAASSKAQFVETKLDLEKMMGFAYATDELLEDVPFMTSLFGRAFALGADRLLTNGVINGDGVGKPLGILHSGALVKVEKETSQESGTVKAENFNKMYHRVMQKNRANAVWVMHPDIAEQLPFMSFKIGTGGVPVYLPSTGIAGNMYDMLFGKPIIEDDNCSAVGNVGDVVFADLKEYMVIKKSNVRSDVSMHVEFLTDQSCFRYIFRVNGAPKTNEPTTIKNSTQKRSPFVTLAARA